MSSPAFAVAPATGAESQNASTSESPLYRLAHELRQPLSTIEAIAYYLEIMLPADQLEARRYLARVRRMVEESNCILINALRQAKDQANSEV